VQTPYSQKILIVHLSLLPQASLSMDRKRHFPVDSDDDDDADDLMALPSAEAQKRARLSPTTALAPPPVLEPPSFRATNITSVELTYTAFTTTPDLGEGGFSDVFTARTHTSPTDLVAVKAFKVSDSGLDHYNTEVAALKALRARSQETLFNVHIINLLAVGSSGSSCLVLSPITSTSLHHHITSSTPGSLSPEFATTVLTQLSIAVEFCHASGVAHMDIKPDNCLLVRNEAEPHLILSDFGCAVGLGRVKGLIGTSQWRPPEASKLSYYDAAPCDVYGLACVYFAALTSSAPFEMSNPHKCGFFSNAGYGYWDDFWAQHGVLNLSAVHKGFFQDLFGPKPEDRPSAAACRQTMREYYASLDAIFPTICVNVRNFADGRVTPCVVPEHTTVRILKEEVIREFMLVPDSFILSYQGTTLRDDRSLSFYGVKPGDLLTTTVKSFLTSAW
jgi:serine/threonine protein kinase